MIHFTFGYQAVFNIEILISNHVYVKLTFSKIVLILISTCTSQIVTQICTLLVFPSLTRCGTTAAIDPVCERVNSESSVLLNVTHGEVYANLSYSVLSLSLIESHCNNSDECDQFSVSFSFVRYRKYILS